MAAAEVASRDHQQLRPPSAHESLQRSTRTEPMHQRHLRYQLRRAATSRSSLSLGCDIAYGSNYAECQRRRPCCHRLSGAPLPLMKSVLHRAAWLPTFRAFATLLVGSHHTAPVCADGQVVCASPGLLDRSISPPMAHTHTQSCYPCRCRGMIDLGSTSIGMRLLVHVLGFNLMTYVFAIFAPLMPDFKRNVSKRD